MGTYYHIADWDGRELISLHYVANIKQGAFSSWSLQGAILNTFLGFAWPGYGSEFGTGWVGRWKRHSIEIHADSADESDDIDEQQEGWPDVGMLFLLHLDSKPHMRGGTHLQHWLECALRDWSQSSRDEIIRSVREWNWDDKGYTTTRKGGKPS